MPLFVILIVFSFVFYIFYKIKYWREKRRPYEKQWIGAKASMSLGALLVFFGLNELLIRQSAAAFIIGGVFIVVGGLYMYQSFRLYRHFLPLAAEERRNDLNGDR